MKKNVLIVSSGFYPEVEKLLLLGACEALNQAKLSFDVIKVPGALEIPTAIYLNKKNYDAFVALGCVIRGETFHFEVVSLESARGLMNLSINYGLIIGNGILTVENYKQAIKRAEPQKLNKGAGAVIAIESLLRIKNGGKN
ncbi:MAG: 6,7-dimethyl-8-ribityllumazine synthase [Alphaproteobacteria bacterium]|jgi:6,7-dimethyl-8-ribityllumazine synthase